jgi:hypothetical protein
MAITSSSIKTLESIDRRVLGAIRFVDAVSGLPVNGFLRIEVRGATIISSTGNTSVPTFPDSVKLLRNRAGLFVIARAPFFDSYTDEFLDPQIPDSFKDKILRLRIALVAVEGAYLPQEFDVDLPRSIDTEIKLSLNSSDNVNSLSLNSAPFVVPVKAGTFAVNGHPVSVNITDTLKHVFDTIKTATGGNVTGSYDAVTDQIVLASDSQITLGSSSDTSNFLVAARLSNNGRNVVRSSGRIAGSVFVPLDIPLFRSPSAPLERGWIIVRTRVLKAGSNDPLPGVLVRVFRSPRMAGDMPIGMGLSDWREHTAGEALVAISGIQKFSTGTGDKVIETQQKIEFEAIRNLSFTGAEDQLPHVTSLLYGSAEGQIVETNLLPVSSGPSPVLDVKAGGEYTVTLKLS